MSVTVILRTNKKPNKKGQYPLALQLIKDGKTSVVHIGQMIKKEEWDGAKVTKAHPNSVRLNNFINKKLAEATDKSLEFSDVSAKVLKNKIKPDSTDRFSGQADIYLNTLQKSGKFNRHSADSPRIKHFKEFAGDVTFAEITPSLLMRFKAELMATRSVSERTAINHLIVIRSVFSQALKDKIIDPKHYPFGKDGVKIKFPDTSKTGLTAEELKRIEDAELPKYQNHARNLWLTSFYFAGMRVSDVMRLKWSDINDGRLAYIMGKNNKGGSLKVPDRAAKIFEQYKENDPTHNLVFPDLKGVASLENNNEVQKRIKARVHEANDQLKFVAAKAEITKPLTMHISRHTFAQLAGDKIPIQMLQKLYRHTSIQTTIGYQSNFIHKDADDALESVLNM